MKQLRFSLAALAFYFGVKAAQVNLTLPQAIVDGIVFFWLGSQLAIYLDRKDRGFPNKFGIPTV